MREQHGWSGVRELHTGEVIGLNGDGRSRIRLLDGRAWVTAETRPDDVFLTAGEGLVTTRGARMVIEALAPSRVRFESHSGWHELRLHLAIALERLAVQVRPAECRT